MAAWHFFVDGDRNSLEATNAITLLLFLGAAVFAMVNRRRRRRFGGTAVFSLATVTIILLFIQLKTYPMITQPRQIVPLAMLSAMLGVELFYWWDRFCGGRDWCVVVLALPLAICGSLKAADYPQHWTGILTWAAIIFVMIGVGSRLRTPWVRMTVFPLAGMFLVVNIGYRYGVMNASREDMWRTFVSKEDAAARSLIENNVAREPTVIA